MTEITTAEAAEVASILEEIANRPLLFDAYPVQDGANTVNLWVREGDALATMRVTQDETDDDGEVVTTEIDTYLTSDEAFHLGLASGDALAALGRRDDLAELIKNLTDTLCKMR